MNCDANLLKRVVLEAGIYLSHIIWRFRYRKLRKEAKESGRSIDELLGQTNNDPPETPGSQAGVVNGDRDVEKQEVRPVVEG